MQHDNALRVNAKMVNLLGNECWRLSLGEEPGVLYVTQIKGSAMAPIMENVFDFLRCSEIGRLCDLLDYFAGAVRGSENTSSLVSVFKSCNLSLVMDDTSCMTWLRSRGGIDAVLKPGVALTVGYPNDKSLGIFKPHVYLSLGEIFPDGSNGRVSLETAYDG